MNGSSRRRFAVFGTAALLAGCFSEHVETTGPNEDDLCGAPTENVIRIRNFAFDPAEITVAAGTELTWVNCDTDVHTSTSDESVWTSGGLVRNETFKRTFAEAGEFPYHCEPHPFMMGSVTVE